MLTYPDFSKPFHIYTDASDTQLGAVIPQEDKHIAFYSRKVKSAETLKEFRNILLGYQITVHTDHKKLTYERWRLLVKVKII
jgi:hypothetical protein